MKIHKGDTVIMLHGKDRKKKGRVIKVKAEERQNSSRRIESGTKHVKAKSKGKKAKRSNCPVAIPSSIAMLICPKCGKQTRCRL